MAALIALVLLPLGVIAAQMACGATGAITNSAYKLAFIIPPLIYCRVHRIDLGRQIFRWHNWRRALALAALLGLLAAGIFGGAYAVIGPLLVDEDTIVGKIESQFNVNAATVLLIAPFTIVINSFVEEFFYRGFAFNLLVQKSRWLGVLLPAAVFTVQHLLFIYHWVGPLALALAVVALLVFALVLEWMYALADSIVAPWLIHVAGDLAMMAIAARMLF